MRRSGPRGVETAFRTAPPRPSVRVGRWVLRQGGPVYAAASLALMLLLCGAAVAAMPHAAALATVLLHLRYGGWILLVLPAALLPFLVLHEGAHIAVLRAAGLPIRIRVGGRLLALRVEVPVAAPRRVALVAALAPQPVVLGAVMLLDRVAPGAWPLGFYVAALAVAGSAGDFLNAAALALSRDEAVVLR